MAEFVASTRATFQKIGADIKALRLGTAAKVNLVDEIDWTQIQYVAHRNGPSIWPEASMEGCVDVFKTGQLHLEVDIQELVDGTFVGCHDATVNSRMLGIGTGNVDTKTQAQWRRAQIRPAYEFGITGTPIFWDDIMDRFGGRMLLLPELKDTNTASAHRFCQDVVRRGLQKAVIIQSFGYAICQIVASYGIPTLFLSGNVPTQTAAQMIADGIGYLGLGHTGTTTPAQITAFKAAGLKVLLYTAVTLDDSRAILAKGANGVFSNDPWYHSGVYTSNPSGIEIYRTKHAPIGMHFHYYNSSGVVATPSGTLDFGRDGQNWARVTGNTVIPYLSMPAYGVAHVPFKATANLEFGANGATGDQGVNMGLIMANNRGSGPFKDGAQTGQQAILMILRRNGTLQSYAYRNGAAAASLGTVTANVEAAPVNTTVSIPIEFTVTATTVQLTAVKSTFTGGRLVGPAWNHGMSAAQLADMDFTLRFMDGPGFSRILNLNIEYL